jgi:Domain of unknown function (DUF4173)
VSHGRNASKGGFVNDAGRTRPSAPVPIAIAAIAAGMIAGALLVDLPPGANWLIVASAVSVAVVVGWRRERPTHLLIFGALSLALVSTALHTATEWQLVLNLLVAVGLASLAVVPAGTWTELVVSSGSAWWRSPGALAWLLRSLSRPSRKQPSGTLPVFRGLALGGFLLLVFGALFVSADEAFAQLADRVLVTPDVSLGLLPFRLIVAGVVMVFAVALASFAPALGVGRGGPLGLIANIGTKVGGGTRLQLGRTEWITALAMLDVLFAAFVVVQITVLFGGREHVLETSGLTYAEYARSGFFQLVAVAALTLLVLGFFARYAQRKGSRDDLLLKLLGGALVVLTLIVLASALKRLALYEEVYGFTRLRVVVHASILWLTGMFCMVSVAGLRGRPSWLPRGVVIFSSIALLVFTVIRPDALIAERNVDRFERTGKIDVSYLAGLSPDAVPALARLPEPERSCALVGLRHELAEPDSLWALNLSRDDAREVLNNSPESGSSLETCPIR